MGISQTADLRVRHFFAFEMLTCKPFMAWRMLCISNDETLLRTRKLLFEHDGYEVTSMLGFVAASECVSAGTFDVMFIGHSVPLRDMQELIHRFRERSDAPIVAVRTPDENWGDGGPGVRILETGHGPQAVLETLREVCKSR